MNPQAAQQYVRTRVLTATPEQLQMMLFDGAIRYGEQARAALEKNNFEVSFAMITRVQKIVSELTTTLKPELAPQLCTKLAALYNYCYRKLIEANTSHTIQSLDEALKIIKYQRETWAMVLEKTAKVKAAAAAARIDIPAPSDRMEATISMRA
jgi:flagellar protein FliS